MNIEGQVLVSDMLAALASVTFPIDVDTKLTIDVEAKDGMVIDVLRNAGALDSIIDDARNDGAEEAREGIADRRAPLDETRDFFRAVANGDDLIIQLTLMQRVFDDEEERRVIEEELRAGMQRRAR